MPSIVLGQPVASGATTVISGNPWSGSQREPVGGIQLLWISSGGACFVGLSGGGPVLSGPTMTVNSGQMALSGGAASGMLDGMYVAPGVPYFLPRLAFPISGIYNLYATCEQAASGVGRLYFEAF